MNNLTATQSYIKFILNLNINNQSVDFLMDNNEQVKINLNKWKKVLES